MHIKREGDLHRIHGEWWRIGILRASGLRRIRTVHTERACGRAAGPRLYRGGVVCHVCESREFFWYW